MAVNLLEAILAGAHGLVGGVNRRRLKKEADAKEATALAYTQSQNAIKNSLAQDTLDFYKRPMAAAAGDRADAAVTNAGSNSLMRDARIKELQGRVPAALALAGANAASREKIAAGHDATMLTATGIRGANALATEGARGGNAMNRLATRLDYNGMAKSATEQFDMAQQHAAEARRYRALAESSYDAPMKLRLGTLADSLDAKADSAEAQGATLLQQLQGAGQAAPADTTADPVDPPLPGEPPDVQGATPDAIETPAPSTGSPQTLGAALAPQPMPQAPTGFNSAMPMTLGSAMQGSGVLGQPYQQRDPIPSWAMAKVRARAKDKGIAEGSPAWTVYLAAQVADFVSKHRAATGGRP